MQDADLAPGVSDYLTDEASGRGARLLALASDQDAWPKDPALAHVPALAGAVMCCGQPSMCAFLSNHETLDKLYHTLVRDGDKYAEPGVPAAGRADGHGLGPVLQASFVIWDELPEAAVSFAAARPAFAAGAVANLHRSRAADIVRRVIRVGVHHPDLKLLETLDDQRFFARVFAVFRPGLDPLLHDGAVDFLASLAAAATQDDTFPAHSTRLRAWLAGSAFTGPPLESLLDAGLATALAPGESDRVHAADAAVRACTELLAAERALPADCSLESVPPLCRALASPDRATQLAARLREAVALGGALPPGQSPPVRAHGYNLLALVTALAGTGYTAVHASLDEAGVVPFLCDQLLGTEATLASHDPPPFVAAACARALVPLVTVPATLASGPPLSVFAALPARVHAARQEQTRRLAPDSDGHTAKSRARAAACRAAIDTLVTAIAESESDALRSAVTACSTFSQLAATERSRQYVPLGGNKPDRPPRNVRNSPFAMMNRNTFWEGLPPVVMAVSERRRLEREAEAERQKMLAEAGSRASDDLTDMFSYSNYAKIPELAEHEQDQLDNIPPPPGDETAVGPGDSTADAGSGSAEGHYGHVPDGLDGAADGKTASKKARPVFSAGFSTELDKQLSELEGGLPGSGEPEATAGSGEGVGAEAAATGAEKPPADGGKGKADGAKKEEEEGKGEKAGGAKKEEEEGKEEKADGAKKAKEEGKEGEEGKPDGGKKEEEGKAADGGNEDASPPAAGAKAADDGKPHDAGSLAVPAPDAADSMAGKRRSSARRRESRGSRRASQGEINVPESLNRMRKGSVRGHAAQTELKSLKVEWMRLEGEQARLLSASRSPRTGTGAKAPAELSSSKRKLFTGKSKRKAGDVGPSDAAPAPDPAGQPAAAGPELKAVEQKIADIKGKIESLESSIAEGKGVRTGSAGVELLPLREAIELEKSVGSIERAVT